MMSGRPLPELVKYRESNNLSREQLADEIGVKPVTIWRWEAGTRRPDRKFAPKISALTGISVAELMGASECPS